MYNIVAGVICLAIDHAPDRDAAGDPTSCNEGDGADRRAVAATRSGGLMAQLTACDNCEKTTKDDRLWWRLDMEDTYRLQEIGWPDPPYQFCSWACVAAYAAKRAKANERPY
jgi:hypothetical protein